MDIRKLKMCANCDDVYIGDACPVCAGQEFVWLAHYAPPVKQSRHKQLLEVFAATVKSGIFGDKTDVIRQISGQG